MSQQNLKSDAQKSREQYFDSLNSVGSRAAWHSGLQTARRSIADALRDSDYLRNIPAALQVSGKHSLVIRHLMAPPQSQDQFKILCPEWPKSSEKIGNSGLDSQKAEAISAIFYDWLDPAICAWLNKNRKPTVNEVRRVFERASCLMAANRVATDRRNMMAAKQENEVAELLEKLGWEKLPSKLVDTRAALNTKQYMHKTRFATTTRPQEVDIACGLGNSYVLAMECKVTNDETNSLKRINDVIKKATAWKQHWGSFVRPAALLQGVIKESDVKRLDDEGVLVFWSHDLTKFRDWITENRAK